MIQFDLAGYRGLLSRALEAGYTVRPVDEIGTVNSPVLYLRHDVDMHLDGALQVADVEQELGVRSCWMVPVTMHFNVWHGPNHRVLRELVERGHRVGLHYEVERTRTDQQLTAQALTLGLAADTRVRAITMHKPGPDGRDPHREHPWYTHPHAERFAHIRYVSDSARKWRDDTLLQALDAREDVQLLTHHEHWIGTATRVGRDYFDMFNRPCIELPARAFAETVWTDLATHR